MTNQHHNTPTMKETSMTATTSKTRLTSVEALHMGVRAAAGDEYSLETSLWDGTGAGEGGKDLTNNVTVGPYRAALDGSVHVFLQDDVLGDPTFLTVTEARDLALLLLVVANRAEKLAARTNRQDAR